MNDFSLRIELVQIWNIIFHFQWTRSTTFCRCSVKSISCIYFIIIYSWAKWESQIFQWHRQLPSLDRRIEILCMCLSFSKPHFDNNEWTKEKRNTTNHLKLNTHMMLNGVSVFFSWTVKYLRAKYQWTQWNVIAHDLNIPGEWRFISPKEQRKKKITLISYHIQLEHTPRFCSRCFLLFYLCFS